MIKVMENIGVLFFLKKMWLLSSRWGNSNGLPQMDHMRLIVCECPKCMAEWWTANRKHDVELFVEAHSWPKNDMGLRSRG
jgi:hypothetical protein